MGEKVECVNERVTTQEGSRMPDERRKHKRFKPQEGAFDSTFFI